MCSQANDHHVIWGDINLNFENWNEPVFTDEQEAKLEQLLNEYDNKGDKVEE